MNVKSASWRQHLLLLMLTLFYIETFVGRQIMAVMIEPIKAEFGASDAQMGLLTGLAFAIVFALTGLSAGRLADRVSRTKLLAASALCWCIFTAISSMATGFIMLLVMRMLIAIAESPVTSSSLSLLADTYPIKHRSFAISCFTSGATISAIIALTVGAHWVEQYGWRQTLLIVSLPALITSLLFVLVFKDPRKIVGSELHLMAQAEKEANALLGFRESAKSLLKLKDYRLLIYASSIATISANAFGMWNATFLVRSHDLSLTQAGLMAGIFGGGGAAIGILLSGYLSDRIARRYGMLKLPLVGHMLGWLSIVTYLLWPKGLGDNLMLASIPFAMIFCSLASFFSVWWFSPSISLLTQIVPNNQRAFAISMQTVCITLLGLGLGPMLVGFFSDIFAGFAGVESLRFALIMTSCSTLVSIVILLRLKLYQSTRTSSASDPINI
ncbi:MFS transporter [Aliiglaciecola lipolytica]|uniref:Major facilitator transporter n=1 Tax=Aliiglaciecola lipolytica E3 TaxID=1127673 RepID=K6Y6Z5_9ALTE|nr:MFS transporter [Aliiglaciecola lipolytica]GAC13992.1 major facilitator transporter [Aliiglaciecola lipolytica E3]